MNLPSALRSTALVVIGVLMSLGIGECAIGFLDKRSGSEKFKRVNRELRERSDRFAAQNPFGFTDIVRDEVAAPGTYRIAVLGDSVVWGDGLPHEEAWSHKLERLMTTHFSNVEVLSWSRNGWSTRNQLEFLRKHGHEFGPDLLIIGFIHNDADVGGLPRMNRGARRTRLGEQLSFLTSVFPRTVERLVELYQNARYGTANDYYRSWIEQLYEPANLERYAALLKALADYCESLPLKLLMVATPSNLREGSSAQFIAKITPLLDAAGIAYLNLLPEARRRFGDYPPAILSANPANNHPGPILTQFFAEEVYAHLLRQHDRSHWIPVSPRGFDGDPASR